MDLHFADAYEWLFPDTIGTPAKKQKKTELNIACGGAAGICAVLTGLKKNSTVSFASDTPGCRFFRMVSVNVTHNTGEHGFAACDWSPKTEWITRDAPFRVYDALQPVSEPVTVSDSGNLLLYVRYDAGKTPGCREITLRFSDGTASTSAAFCVNVHAVSLPEAGRNSICFTNWINLANVAETAKTKLWTARFWAALREHACMMKDARQNTFIVPLRLFYEEKDGHPVLQTARLKKYVEIFTDAGLYWIEGGHMAVRINGEWNATDFNVIGSEYSVRSAEGNNRLAELLIPLRKLIGRCGWEKRWLQHAADEPLDCNADSYRILAGTIRKYMRDTPLTDANFSLQVASVIDIWCPQVQAYQERKAEYDTMRKNGDKIWAYTCCNPGGKYLNRLLDGELARPLLLGWGCAANGIEGYLHWGWNWHVSGSDPIEMTSGPLGNNILPAGDMNIIYPGHDGNLWSSMRLEAHRAGIEAWELIRKLQKTDPAKAAKIVKKVFRTFNDYTADAAVIRKAEKELLTALTAVK